MNNSLRRLIAGVVEFVAAAGTTNSLTITNVGDTVTFDDRVAIRAGEGCESVPGDRTSCDAPRRRRPGG